MASLAQPAASNTSLLATVSATFTQAPEAGNLLVAFITASVGVGSIAISNSGWTAGPSIAVGIAGGMAAFYKVAASGGGDTTVTSTATLATFMDLQIFEWDGIDNAVPLDKSATSADSGSGVTSHATGSTGTLTQANELAVGAVAQVTANGGGASWNSSFATDVVTTHLISGDLTVTSTSALNPTASWTNSVRAAGLIMTFFGETGAPDSSGGGGSNGPLKPRIISVNWGNPLTRGMIVDIPMFEGGGTTVKDFCGNILAATLNATTTWKVYKKINFANASNDFISLGTYLSTTLSTRATVVAKRRKTDATNRGGVLFGTDNTVSNTRIFQSHCPFLDGTVYWDFGGNVAGVTRVSAAGLTFGNDLFIYTVGPSYGMNIWQNGILRATSNITPTRNTTAVTSAINRTTGGITGDLMDMELFRVYNRELTPEEIKITSVNPWQIYNQPGLLYNKSL